MITLHRTRPATVSARQSERGPWGVFFPDGQMITVAPEAFELLFERSEPSKPEHRLRSAVVYAEDRDRYWNVYCPENHILSVRPHVFEVLFTPAKAKNLRSLLSHAAWRSSKPWGDRYDWQLGEEMWRLGKRTQEIARTLGCSENAVKSRARRHGWKREEAPIDRRTEDRGTQRKQERRILENPAACPACWKVTLTDPCAHCHMQLPINGS